MENSPAEEVVDAAVEPVAPKPALVPIDSVDQVMGILVAWHRNKLNRLRHLMQIPTGTPFTDQNGVEQKMEGVLRDGFIAGLIVARSEFEQLPFQVLVQSEEAAAEPVVDAPVNEPG